jgi:GNAT superfamily N-acetyltransferase
VLDVRVAAPEDAPAVADVHVRSWQTAYRGLLPDAYLDELRAEDRASRYLFDSSDPGAPSTSVATVDGAICGFVTTGPSADDDAPGSGEVLALYVDPQAWGIGAGRILLEGARRRLYDQGFSDAVLWVLAGNHRAERFYRVDGWEPDGCRRILPVWGVEVDESRFRRPLP